MTHDDWTTGDDELRGEMRALYAAPSADHYWIHLEERILGFVARGGHTSAWWGELTDMMRPGLVAAAGLVLAASLALMQSRRAEMRNAYASVISSTAPSTEAASRAASVGDGDLAMQILLSH